MTRIGVRRAALAVIALSFVVSLICFVPGMATRRVFVFPAVRADGSEGTAVEARYLPRHPVQGSIPLFVDEMLLGPQSQRARPLFARGTKAEFCFLRGRTLYVGLSKDALFPPAGAENILANIALFRQNVRRNFSSVGEVMLFIDGKYVE